MPAPWLVIPDSMFPSQRDRFTFISLPAHSSARWTLRGSRCVGSSGGWLALLDANLSLTLLNPLSTNVHAQVRLPPLRREGHLFPFLDLAFGGSKANRLQHELVKKVAFSGDPTAEDYSVAALCRFKLGLAFTNAGLGGWQWLDWPDAAGRPVSEAADAEGHQDDINTDLDIVYHDGRFYYMTLCGLIWTLDAAAPPPVAPVPFAKCRPPGPDHLRYGKHLVFTDDGALHVVWGDGPGLFYHNRARPCMSVQRYEPGSRRWMKVRHLGGRAFLIGKRRQSVAAPASAASAPSTWIRPNYVYFTDIMQGSDVISEREFKYLEQDIWEFDVKAGDFQACDRGGFSDWLEWPKAIWFTPSMP